MNVLKLLPLPKKLFRYNLGIELHRAVFGTGRGTAWTSDELFLKRTSISDIWVSLQSGRGEMKKVQSYFIQLRSLMDLACCCLLRFLPRRGAFPVNGWDELPASFVSDCEGRVLMEILERPRGDGERHSAK